MLQNQQLLTAKLELETELDELRNQLSALQSRLDSLPNATTPVESDDSAAVEVLKAEV